MITVVLDSPWKLRNMIRRWIVLPLVRTQFAVCGIKWNRGWRIHGLPIIQKHRHGTIQFGSGLDLRSSLLSNPLSPSHPVVLCTWRAGAVLEVGANFGMTGGSIVAADRITIGNNVTVGANTNIIDTDFHPLDLQERRVHPNNATAAPVVIEDDVFIGMNCLILKGVTVGYSSVIGAGSVVTKNVPPCVIVAGNPAKIIRELT